MGLTIHYKLALREDISSDAARELVERVARHAKEIGCAEISKMIQVEPDFPLASLYVRSGTEEDGCLVDVSPLNGWMISVCPGDGCESVFLALCQYPAEIEYDGKLLATGYSGGWMFQGACKTQFAAEHGWEHFLRCHKAVIQLLEFWQQLGVTVEATDEGGYWESRSEDKLRAMLQRYDGLVAAVGGLLKDAGKSVESPIFERRDFEKLEAAGQQSFGKLLSELSDVQDGLFNLPPGENPTQRQ